MLLLPSIMGATANSPPFAAGNLAAVFLVMLQMRLARYRFEANWDWIGIVCGYILCHPEATKSLVY